MSCSFSKLVLLTLLSYKLQLLDSHTHTLNRSAVWLNYFYATMILCNCEDGCVSACVRSRGGDWEG